MIVFISFFHFSFVAIFHRGHTTSRLQLRFPLMYFMFPQFPIFHVHFGCFFYPPFSGWSFLLLRFMFSMWPCPLPIFLLLFLCPMKFLFSVPPFPVFHPLSILFSILSSIPIPALGSIVHFFLALEFNSPLCSGCFFCSFFFLFLFSCTRSFYINDKTNRKC